MYKMLNDRIGKIETINMQNPSKKIDLKSDCLVSLC